MSAARTVRPTRIRRFLNGLDSATFGVSGRTFALLDRSTGGNVTAAAHRALYRARQAGLRVRVAIGGRDLRLLAGPKPVDLAEAERGDGPAVHSATTKVRVRSGPPRILFASEMRRTISGNLRQIRDRMYERGLGADFDMRYSFRTLDMVTPQGSAVLASEVAAADIILIDDYFPLLNKVTLRADQKLIQVWHAGSGFKSVGYSRFGNYGSPRLTDTHRKYTFAICGSHHLVHVYAEVFGIPEEAVIPTGLPRIDSFLDPLRTAHITADFEATYPHIVGKRKILFAPTFRGEGAQTAYYDYDQLDFARLYELCGEDSVLLIRMHHFIADPPPVPEQYRDRIYDFSHFPDGNDLLHSVDLLITDYSSIIYEYSLLDRPMLFFAYDRDLYSATRGFHRDYDDMAPGRVCLSFDELVSAIEEEDFEQWKVERFRNENFDHIDTNSADRVIDQLILADPRQSEEAIANAQRDQARAERALRLAAEQVHVEQPHHEGAKRAVERYIQLDREADNTTTAFGSGAKHDGEPAPVSVADDMVKHS
ncbi:MAG: CDP-glycerol glycerophosphotransferase family protein [Microbacterium sp.]